MNDDEIEDILRREAPGLPSEELDRRMDAMFEKAARRRRWFSQWARPVPAWALAAACAVSAACGFFADSLSRSWRRPAPLTAPLAICMIDSDRALARRLLGPADGRTPTRPACHISVQTDDPPQPEN